MKTLKSFAKSAKYALWAFLAVVFGVVILLVRSFFSGERKEGTGRLPEVPQKLKAKVEKVEEEALIARVEARVEAEQAEKHLEEVAAIDDGAERRARLAETLRNLK
jgi:hypothetical protein